MRNYPMLNLLKLGKQTITRNRQRQDRLITLEPIIDRAVDLIAEELAPFREYGRQPHYDLSSGTDCIHLGVALTLAPQKHYEFDWLRAAFKPGSNGQVWANSEINGNPYNAIHTKLHIIFCGFSKLKLKSHSCAYCLTETHSGRCNRNTVRVSRSRSRNLDERPV